MFDNFFLFLLCFFLVILLDIGIVPTKDKTQLYSVVIRDANLLFVFSCGLFLFYDTLSFPFQYEYIFPLFTWHNFYYHIGLDAVSICFIILSAFLLPFCVLISWQSILYRRKAFFFLLFLVVFFLFNVFSVLDLFFFYFFFEAILVPMFILIGV